jgi:hypothetical protein
VGTGQEQRARVPAPHDQIQDMRIQIFEAKRKWPHSFLNVAIIYAGNDLLSHTLSRAVQSALRGLT